jgi:hypothetical protein
MDSAVLGWMLVGAGVVLALVGRHVFWLAVGLVGFLLTSSLVRALLPDLDPTVVTVLALAVGAAGAIVTVKSLRLVAAIAAALLLAVVGRALFVLYVDDSAWQWLVFAGAGALGWLLVRVLFDVGIVVTTALWVPPMSTSRRLRRCGSGWGRRWWACSSSRVRCADRRSRPGLPSPRRRTSRAPTPRQGRGPFT